MIVTVVFIIGIIETTIVLVVIPTKVVKEIIIDMTIGMITETIIEIRIETLVTMAEVHTTTEVITTEVR